MEPCRQLKEDYDACFNLWFSQQFLKGDNNDEVCAPLLKVYKECVKKAMKENNIDLKEIDKPELGTPNEKKAPP